MCVAEITKRSLTLVAPERPIREAAELMRRDHIGDVVVARREREGAQRH